MIRTTLSRISGRAFVAAALLAPTLAQNPLEDGLQRPRDLDRTVLSWRARFGAPWQAKVDSSTGWVELLAGGNAPAPFQPSTTEDADWFALARHWVAEAEPLMGVSGAELSDERVVYLPLGMAHGTDKLTVRLRQSLHGLPVENGVVNALFDTNGRLLSLHSTAAPLTDDLGSVPSLSAGAARRAALEAFGLQHDVPVREVREAQLLFAQVDRGMGREARLAWQVGVLNEDVPVGTLYTIDAHTGDVLRRDSLIHFFDVFGKVESNATPGLEADHAGNPPAPLAMPYISVKSSAGTVQTDRDGNFVFPGVNTPLDITVEYNGTFANVNNQAGSDYTITFTGVQPGVNNTLLMNPSPGELRTAQANGLLRIGMLRDFIRDTVPTDSHADFKGTCNVNLNSTCNAYYNGNSTNYYRDGGSCNNTAFSTVIAHEMGHWLNDRYGTGNGSDGMGEGNADVFAMYNYDDPIVGRYFTNGGGYVRSGNNNRKFCGDNNGGCYGEVHADGEVWMGAAWKVRTKLKNELGSALGGQTADLLFLGWMNAYNQGQIKSIIETQWLTLDDDNGDLTDGTPNFTEIDAGFRQQGFPGIDIDFVQFANVTKLPDYPSDQGPYAVSADIDAVVNAPLASADLYWRVDGGAWSSAPMAFGGGITWSGAIPSLGGTGVVEYYVSATDSKGKTGEYPPNGPDGPANFAVGNVQTLFAWDFEAATDEGWSMGHPNDDATTGLWERGDPLGTTAQPEDDHTASGTKCWFTGQGTAGGGQSENDVDNGKTSLLSPVLDLSGKTGVRVHFWRWFSNDEGNNPAQDVFRARVSFDGGSTWSTVEETGPLGEQASGEWFEGSYLIDAYGTPSASMVLRFVATDDGDPSVVEAAVDDIVVTWIDPNQGCAAPTNYCVGAPNSAGPGAVMGWSGSQDVNDANFTLSATGLPANKFGFFFYGAGQTQTPAGDGFLCVSGQLYRLPVVQSNASGFASVAVDFSNLPNGGDILNGSTWNFQLGYRDKTGGPVGFNFSDALEVPFCD